MRFHSSCRFSPVRRATAGRSRNTVLPVVWPGPASRVFIARWSLFVARPENELIFRVLLLFLLATIFRDKSQIFLIFPVKIRHTTLGFFGLCQALSPRGCVFVCRSSPSRRRRTKPSSNSTLDEVRRAREEKIFLVRKTSAAVCGEFHYGTCGPGRARKMQPDETRRLSRVRSGWVPPGAANSAGTIRTGRKPLPQTKVANKSKWRLFDEANTHTHRGRLKPWRPERDRRLLLAPSNGRTHTHTTTAATERVEANPAEELLFFFETDCRSKRRRRRPSKFSARELAAAAGAAAALTHLTD